MITRRSALGASLALPLLATILSAAALAPGAARAHSLEELQGQLFEKEEFFQIKDEQAPGFRLQDSQGRPVGLQDLRGKVVVLHFIYAGCPDVCPLHAERIAEIQEMVNVTPMKELVQFITITTDPFRDTSDVLEAYGQAHGLDRVNWAFLTISKDQAEDTTRRLAEQFGHKFTPTDDGMQMHGVVTHVIDQGGRLVANFHGLRFEPTNLVLFVNALTNDPGRPHGHEQKSWWQRVQDLF